MPVDRILRNLIMWQRADGPPVPIRALTVEQARARYLANAIRPRRDDDDISIIDRTIGTPSFPVRVYTPPADRGRVITFLHGGGWVLGDLDSHDGICRRLATTLGAIVVSAGYRRAPEFPYPAPLLDAAAAARWTSRSFPDRDHVIAGDSAGASLALGVALDTPDVEFAAQLLLYPPVDQSLHLASKSPYAEGYLLSVDDMAFYYGLYCPDPRRRDDIALNLLDADLRDMPPAVVATAEFDPLHAEGLELVDELIASDVPVIHVPGPGLVHGYFQMQDTVPAAATCAQRVLGELETVLRSPARVATRR
jgi:acetyl esterase